MADGAIYPGVRSAHHYVRDILDGTILVNKWVRLACERHRKDLIRSATDPDWPYRFDAEAAERAIRFIELMPHVKGKWAARRKRLTLSPWQRFLVASIFGWLEKKATEGRHLRRFREATLIVPRKNGKSALAAAIGLYMFCADGEFGAEVYSGATSLDQAMEVFKPAHLMVQRTPGLRRRWKITVAARSLMLPDGSKFQPIIGKPGDGASPSCALIDEYHEHDTDAMVETQRTGMGAREQPLELVITTAGSNIEGPCYTHQKRLEEILAGTVEDDRAFGLIYGIDKNDDFRADAALIKANPNVDVSVGLEFLQRARDNAVQQPSSLAAFQTKHLNIWVQARHPYFNMEQWNALEDKALNTADFTADEMFGGFDLASKEDLAAYIPVFRRGSGKDAHYYIVSPKFYLPEAAAGAVKNRHYHGWHDQGHLTVTDGNIIDLEYIARDALQDLETRRVEGLGFDQYSATMMVTHILNEMPDAPLIEVPMKTMVLSEPMKWISALMKDGRIHHDGNPIMTWCMANVVAKVDANENVFPRKEQPRSKIDGAVALIIAMTRALTPADLGDTVTQGFVEI